MRAPHRLWLGLTAVAASLTAPQAVAANQVAAQAPVLDFYGMPGSLFESATSVPHFTVGNVDVTVRAFVGSTPALVDIAWGGLGVTSDKPGNAGAIGRGESLQFTFNQPVTLAGLLVSGWNSTVFGSLDRAILSWGDHTMTLAQGADGLLVKRFDLSELTTSSFTLTGESLFTHFRVAGLQLANPNGPVPEPGTWALMGLGLLGLGLTRRRARAGQVSSRDAMAQKSR